MTLSSRQRSDRVAEVCVSSGSEDGVDEQVSLSMLG